MSKSPFSFILIHSFKNSLKRIIHKPALLIYLIFFIAVLVFTIIGGAKSEGSYNPGSMGELTVCVNLLFSVIFVLAGKSGFDKGGSIFSMPDVNMMFTSPLENQKILYYSMLRQAKVSIFAGFFILFQYGWMHGRYGISFGELLILMVLFGAVLFAGQFLAMVLCSYFANHKRTKSAVKYIFLMVIAVYAGSIIINLFVNRSTWLSSSVSFIVVYGYLFPVSGWTAGIFGMFTGVYSVLQGIIFASLYVVTIFIMAALMKSGTTDYYEDVLQTTEHNWGALSAQRNGKIAEAAPENVKKGHIGLEQGNGASAFFYKHQIENRRNGKFVIGKMDLLFFGMTVIFALFMKNTDGGLYTAFGFGIYMEIFTVSMGRFSRELEKPFIYLIPEKSLKKLLYASLENIKMELVISVLTAVAFKFVFDLNFIGVIEVCFSYFSFSLLFMSAFLIMQRLFGGLSSRGLMILFLIICVLILITPGIFFAVLVHSISPFTAMGIINIPVAFLVFFLCRKVLDNAELNS